MFTPPPRTNQKKDLTVKFWSFVEKTESCWLWRGGLHQKGYGSMGDGDGSHVRAHRYSYLLHFGPIPKGKMVCHKCDNPPCVNPEHLFLGTAQSNMDDMIQKGRARHPARHALTASDIEFISGAHASGKSLRQIAGVLRVSHHTVSRVLHRL